MVNMRTKICESVKDENGKLKEKVLKITPGQLMVSKGMSIWNGDDHYIVQDFWYQIDEDCFYVWVK